MSEERLPGCQHWSLRLTSGRILVIQDPHLLPGDLPLQKRDHLYPGSKAEAEGGSVIVGLRAKRGAARMSNSLWLLGVSWTKTPHRGI